MKILSMYLLAQQVSLAKSLVCPRPTSSTRPTTCPGLEFPNMEIRLASSTRPATGLCSPN